MDVAVNAAAGALKAFFADLPDPLIPYSLHPELVEAASKKMHTNTNKQTIQEESGVTNLGEMIRNCTLIPASLKRKGCEYEATQR